MHHCSQSFAFKFKRGEGPFVSLLMRGFQFIIQEKNGFIEAKKYKSSEDADEISVDINILSPFDVYLID